MQIDLTKEEWEALAEHLREHIKYTRHPAASALVHLKAILIKLDPEAAQEPLPDQRR